MEADDRTRRPDKPGDGVVHIIHDVVFRRIARPHAVIDVILDVSAQFAERFAGCGQRLGLSAAIHHKVNIMHAPVNQRAAAGYGFVGEISAEARNGAVRPETGENMVDFAQLAAVDDLFNPVNRCCKPVAYANAEYLARFVRSALHIQRLGKNPCRRFLAQHIFARAKEVDGYQRVRVVMRANRNGVHCRIRQNLLVIINRFAAAVFFNRFIRFPRHDIAEI